MKKAVAYYRVSTDKQGKSGLGLEAQQNAINLFSQRESYTIVDEFSEVESGKKNQRPQLNMALALCKKIKATLIIAKLDRLGRNVAFISNLMESNVDFKAVDNPHASKFMLHMLAAFAEHEREQISIRTKDALQAAKRRGIELGKHGKYVESKVNAAAAIEYAKKMSPILAQLHSEGYFTIRALRDELNRRGIETFRKEGKWHNCSVHKLVKRVEELV